MTGLGARAVQHGWFTGDRPDSEEVMVRRSVAEAAVTIAGFVADDKPIGPTGRNLAALVRDKVGARLLATPLQPDPTEPGT